MITFNSYQDFSTQLALVSQVSPSMAQWLGRTLTETSRQDHAKFLHCAMGYRPDQSEY